MIVHPVNISNITIDMIESKYIIDLSFPTFMCPQPTVWLFFDIFRQQIDILPGYFSFIRGVRFGAYGDTRYFIITL